MTAMLSTPLLASLVAASIQRGTPKRLRGPDVP